MVFFSIQSAIFALLCLGLNVQWGYTGLFNIGIAGFYALGAYTSALISGLPPTAEDYRVVGGFELPFIFGLIGAMGVSGTVAALISIPVLRLKEDYLAIATIGIAEVIRHLLQNESWLSNGVWGIKHIPSPFQRPVQSILDGWVTAQPDWPGWLQRIVSAAYNLFYLLLVLVALWIAYRVVSRLSASPWGRVLKAIREDEVVAAAAGKNTFLFKMQSMILGAMLMGAGGAFYAHFAKFIDAPSFDPLLGTFLIWVMLIVGGSGNNRGAILGAFVVWGIWAGSDFLTGFLAMEGYRSAALRILLIALLLEMALLLRPEGLLPARKTLYPTPEGSREPG